MSGRWQCGSREERHKLHEWGHSELQGFTARRVPLSFGSQCRRSESAAEELARLADPKKLDGEVATARRSRDEGSCVENIALPSCREGD